MNEIIKLLTLEPLKGKRSQITIVIMGIINVLVQLGILKLSLDDMTKINQFLTWALMYFFADKVSK